MNLLRKATSVAALILGIVIPTQAAIVGLQNFQSPTFHPFLFSDGETLFDHSVVAEVGFFEGGIPEIPLDLTPDAIRGLRDQFETFDQPQNLHLIADRGNRFFTAQFQAPIEWREGSANDLPIVDQRLAIWFYTGDSPDAPGSDVLLIISDRIFDEDGQFGIPPFQLDTVLGNEQLLIGSVGAIEDDVFGPLSGFKAAQVVPEPSALHLVALPAVLFAFWQARRRLG